MRKGTNRLCGALWSREPGDEANRSETPPVERTQLGAGLRIPGTRLRVLQVVAALAVTLAVARLEAQSIASTAAREDFDVLWKAIREAHGGLHRFLSPAELDLRVEVHRARLDRPMTVRALAGLLSESIAELRDGHARLELDSVTAAALTTDPVMPLRVSIENERLIVAFNDSPTDTTLRPGMEILSINGHASADLLRNMLRKVSGDGFIETGKRARLSRDFAQQYWLHVEPGDSYRIVARDGSRTVSAILPGILERARREVNNPVNATIATNLARLDGPLGYVALDFLGEGWVARLRVRAFGGEGFLATLDSAFAVLRERGTTALILDLRGNGGGVDEYGAGLVSWFTDRPFRYFDYIRVSTIAPSFATWLQRTFEAMRTGTVPDSGGFRITSGLHGGVSEQQPAAAPFTGRLVVLIDGGTFSTAADVAAQLRSMGRATFLGEETGGGYEGNTSGLNALIVLPNSRLRLRIMMYDYWNAVKPPPARGRGTLPDEVVVRRVSDVLRGSDPPLERAAAILRSP